MTPQGKVYDVTGNKAYQTGGSYNGKAFPIFLLLSSAPQQTHF